ncbi:MAG: hypothetical protein WDA18_03555 [Candidatus Ratteibacteria bacterium]
MSGKEIRMSRFFSRGKPVVVAIDHGNYFGPIEGLIDLKETVSKLSNVDGILMTPFIVSHVKQVFYGKSSPSMILRVNWTTSLCHPWKYQEAHTRLVMEPMDALARGADAVLAALTLHSGSEKIDAENVKVFTKIARKAEQAGIPLIGEVIPLVPPAEREFLHDRVRDIVRIAWELGADLIKTLYTGKDFHEIVSGVPIPVFALGGEKTNTEEGALDLARSALSAGAKGVVFGRNVFQAKDPAKFVELLQEVVKS